MNRSPQPTSDPGDTGAAQFLANLSPRQIQHLQFSLPKKGEPERFSVFLEAPRQVPVPKRFTFNVLDIAARQVAEQDAQKAAFQNLAQGDVKAGRSRSDTAKSNSSTASTLKKKASVEIMKEVDRVREALDWRFYATGSCLILMNLLMAWDATMLPIALPTIATTFSGSSLNAFWLSIASLAAATCFLPLFASLSDIFSRKPMLIAALTFFTFGSFITAVSGSFTGLHLGRSIQGIGAGGIFVLSNLIIADLVSDVDRRNWAAILGATWAIGVVTGPLIGGSLAARGQWRWIFWLDLPFCALIFGILPFFAKLKAASPGSILEKLRNVDWMGHVLFSGSFVSVLLGLTWGGTEHAWSSFRTTLPIQLGLVGFLLLFLWSYLLPFKPIIDLNRFLDPTTLVTYLGAIVQGLITFSALYFLPLYFNVAKPSYSLVITGLCLCAWSIPMSACALVTFLLVANTKMLRPAIWVGWVLVVIGVSLTILFTQASTPATWILIAMVTGAGLGILFTAYSTASQMIAKALCENEESSNAAVTNFAFFQMLGRVLGVAISSAIFQNRFFRELLKNDVLHTSALQDAKNSLMLVAKIQILSTVPDTLTAQVAAAFIQAMRPIWVVLAALAGAAMVASIFFKMVEDNRRSDRELDTLVGSHAA